MNGEVLLNQVTADQPIRLSDIDSPYAQHSELSALIAKRGVDPLEP